MSKTTPDADTWELNEFLAVLCELTRDASSTASTPETEADDSLPAARDLLADSR